MEFEKINKKPASFRNGTLYKLSEPVTQEDFTTSYAVSSAGLETILGEYESWNVFLTDENGECKDWIALIDYENPENTPAWVYDLPST